MKKKNHIVLLCSRLDLPGGIERAVVNTANLFAEKGQPVTLLILDITKKSFYPINTGVQIIQQPLSFGITPEGNIITRKIKLLSDVLVLRKILKSLNPGTVITTEYPFTIAAVLTRCKKYVHLVAWEHHHFSWIKRNRFWETLYNFAYPGLHDIVCLNKEESGHYEKFAPVSIIPNFVESVSDRNKEFGSKIILSVGWLIPRKGIDLLIKSAKEVLLHHPDWKWKLIGEGEMEKEVLEFIAKEKLEDRFILQKPFDTNITDEYKAAELFVLSSRYEAFPMVLLEALSFGVPCISFDCPSGPSEIINQDEDGLLVEKENPEKLAEAVSSLVKDETTRKRMSENAVINIKRYSKDKVYFLWEKLLQKL